MSMLASDCHPNVTENEDSLYGFGCNSFPDKTYLLCFSISGDAGFNSVDPNLPAHEFSGEFRWDAKRYIELQCLDLEGGTYFLELDIRRSRHSDTYILSTY